MLSSNAKVKVLMYISFFLVCLNVIDVYLKYNTIYIIINKKIYYKN